MAAKANFYDSTGKLILSNSDVCLVSNPAHIINIPTDGQSKNTSQYGHVEDFNAFQDAQTGEYNTHGYLAYQWYSFVWDKALNIPINSAVWFGINEGSGVFMIEKSVSADGSNNAVNTTKYLNAGISRSGTGVKLAVTPLSTLNQYRGMFNSYDPLGNLNWSDRSIIAAPKILEVLNLGPDKKTRDDVLIVDLNKYGVDVNKLYVLPTVNGRVSYDNFFTYVGIIAKRVNNKLYIRGLIRTTGNVDAYYIREVFGNGGINLPIAYFPNG